MDSSSQRKWDGDDRPAGIALSHDGTKLFVTGTVTGLSRIGGLRYNALTVAYDASTGTADWKVSFFHPSRGTSLAVRSDGDLLVIVHEDDTHRFGGWRQLYDPATGSKSRFWRPVELQGHCRVPDGRVAEHW